MKLNDNDRKKAFKIIESFGEKRGPIINDKGRLVAKPYVIEYVKKRLSENYRPLANYNIEGAIYSIERINTYLYITREIEGADTKRVMLNASDLGLVENINKVTRTEMRALVEKIDWNEMRFGLWKQLQSQAIKMQ